MTQKVPQHIGVIFDGNRRWAKSLGKMPYEGHEAGAARIFDFLEWCAQAKVKTVTLYLLSLENFAREPQELKPLLSILEQVVHTIGASTSYRAQHLGSEEVLPSSLRKELECSVANTHNNTGLVVNMAIGYGGRQEIVDAVKAYVANSAEDAQTAIERLTVDDISQYTYTKGMQEPDLIIRTSGEQRLSGFMLWQSTYSEFYFCDVMWPDFSEVEFHKALENFSHRKRRFGA